MSNRVRFDVFKRDSFACQYCGAAAPNVQLHVDHVTPVSDGGSDDLSNLVTACAACNFGKGARNLEENERAALVAEREVAGSGEPHCDPTDPTDPTDPKDLNHPIYRDKVSNDFAEGGGHARAIRERRAQLEMMIEWREEVIGLQDEAIDALDRRIVERTGLSMSEEHRQRMRRWVRRHGLAAVFEALEDALDQMLEWQDGVVTIVSWERALSAIPQVAELGRIARDNPHFRELVYICGLLRRRLPYFNELRCLRLMEDGVQAGASIEAIKAFARTVKSWTAFRRGIEEYIKDYAAGDDMAAGGGDADPPGQDERTDAAEEGAGAGSGGLRTDPSALPEAPFAKSRPLRHFVAEGEIGGSGARYRHSDQPDLTGGPRGVKR